ILATPEVAWSTPARKVWEHYVARLPGQQHILDQLQVRYRVPQRKCYPFLFGELLVAVFLQINNKNPT
ncbi:hypothetical protein SJS85_21415, partial [Aeromonas caviae]|uniref:hypothetical protein n=1 Tax=Aeromonas caviae TaxID=648 RepID=UPI0029DD3AC5